MSRSVELQRARPLLGTFVEIKASAPDEATARRAIERGFAAVARVHTLMSFHEPTSELSALNRDAVRRAVRVHAWTARVLRSALRFSRESNGVFDVAVSHRGDGDWRDIDVDRHNRVRFARPLRIDLGGIAKGFAVDRAIAALRTAGATAGIVNAGGDLRVFGETAEVVRIRAATNPGSSGAFIALRNRAVATSAFYFNGQIVHGHSRDAIAEDSSATVSAPDCMTADALTKLALLLREQARPFLEHYSADAFLLDADGGLCWLSDSHASQRHQA